MQMGPLRWIEALPLAILAAYLNDHKRRTRLGGTITLPQRYSFLQRMDFFRTIGVTIRETFQRHEPSGRFVPVREIEASRQVYEASAEIVETLRVDDNNAANVLRHCIGEIIDNVFVHAASRTHATICAQHFPNACLTQVGIVDTGIGFRASFAASPTFKPMRLTDRNSITLGLAPYITSKPYVAGMYESAGYGRLGVGLFIVANVLKEIGGRLQIASGNALFHLDRWRTIRPWQGAIIGFEVPDVPRVSYQDALRVARHRALVIASAREGA